MTSADESIFRYDDGFSHANFSFPDFVPTFIDEADPALVEEAEGLCNNNTQCVFDYVVTGNRDLAAETAATDQAAATTAEEISKSFKSIVEIGNLIKTI